MNIIENKTNKNIDDVICITKRDGNKKRKYLILNKLQGKYIPVKGDIALEMFDQLANEVKQYEGNIIVIGFAETATAIGARIAYDLALNENNHVTYLTTTREQCNVEPICEFKEEHSHAVEQILYGNKEEFQNANYIIFAEDEVTTGNTICNCVKELNLNCKFVVASLLNCMNDDEISRFKENNITPYWLIKTDKQGFDKVENDEIIPKKIYYPMDNPRIGIDILTYHKKIEELSKQLIEDIPINNKVLVLGTEECSYPSIVMSSILEQKGYDSFVESTTRVPTCIEGILSNRCKIDSLYGDRKTYLYNIEKYDSAICITDGKKDANELIESLISFGIKDIKIVYIGG